MKNNYVLYQKGLANSTEIIKYGNKICIRENSSGGEHLLYISNAGIKNLLAALEPRNILKKWFSSKSKERLSDADRKEKVMRLLAEKFTNHDKDPGQDIRLFLKKHQIAFESSYWPDSDRF